MLRESFFERLCELIGARGTSPVAVGAFKESYDLISGSADCELCYSLSITVAAADELNAFYNAVLDIDVDKT